VSILIRIYYGSYIDTPSGPFTDLSIGALQTGTPIVCSTDSL